MARPTRFCRASVDIGFEPPSSRSRAYFTEGSPLLYDEELAGLAAMDDTLPKVRLELLSQVYGLLTLQFVVITSMCMIFVHYDPLRSLVTALGPLLISFSGAASLTSLVGVMGCIFDTGNTVVWMFTFSFWQGVLLGATCVFQAETGYGPLIIQSLATSLVFLTGITLYTSVSHWGFSVHAAALYALFVFGAMCIITSHTVDFPGKACAWVRAAFLFITSTLYAFIVLYNTHMFKDLLGPDDTVEAAAILQTTHLILVLQLLGVGADQ